MYHGHFYHVAISPIYTLVHGSNILKKCTNSEVVSGENVLKTTRAQFISTGYKLTFFLSYLVHFRAL